MQLARENFWFGVSAREGLLFYLKFASCYAAQPQGTMRLKMHDGEIFGGGILMDMDCGCGCEEGVREGI